jgi:hypothetical protein
MLVASWVLPHVIRACPTELTLSRTSGAPPGTYSYGNVAFSWLGTTHICRGRKRGQNGKPLSRDLWRSGEGKNVHQPCIQVSNSSKCNFSFIAAGKQCHLAAIRVISRRAAHVGLLVIATPPPLSIPSRCPLLRFKSNQKSRAARE